MPRRLLRGLLPGVALMLAACADLSIGPAGLPVRAVQTPYVQQPLSEAWITSDSIQLVLERTDRAVTEQRILLSNLTAMRGENLILLRADRSPLALESRFQPSAMLPEDEDGGESTPYPFEPLDKLAFRTREDALGPLHWARWTNHAGLTCVLAFRRLEKTTRTLAAGASVMDVMLRNCINGDEATALAPIGADAVGFAATAAGPSSAPRMLSPLAAPQP